MPGGDFHPWLFVIVAAWVLVCALGVVASKKVMYSAVSMVLCFLGVAFAYALLHAELIAIMQILVYVGAISIVILFAIMLTEVQDGEYRQFFNRQAIAAAVLAALAAAAISVTIVAADIGPIGEKTLNPGVRELSSLLFDRYVLPFELVSLVLLAAMIGAIVLARKEEERR
jgi:NADH-quinone oxidoreductase subunit J